MNQSSQDHTLQDVRPSPGPGSGAVSPQSSRDLRRERSLPGTTVRKEGRAISVELFHVDEGPRDAPVLVLSGALGSTVEMWQPQLAALSGTRLGASDGLS